MIFYWIFLVNSVFILHSHANENQPKRTIFNLEMIEHKPKDPLENPSVLPTTTEKTLIRVTRDLVQRRLVRQGVDGGEIWGMAKKVAITVIVTVSLCIVCCVVSTVYICIRCCCGGGNSRRYKRDQAPQTIHVPQPIYIHTSPSPYTHQAAQQSASMMPSWTAENQPMLPPQPSAPPAPAQSFDEYAMERPPPYEKICAHN